MREWEHISIIPKIYAQDNKNSKDMCGGNNSQGAPLSKPYGFPNVEVAAKVDLSPVDLNIYLLEQDGREVPLTFKEFLTVGSIKSVKEETVLLEPGDISFIRGLLKSEDNQYFKYAYLRYGTGTNQTKNVPWDSKFTIFKFNEG
jgi:hypothetical protein